jgi:transposase
MRVKAGPAVRLCAACGQLKSAGQFAPGKHICVACQAGRAARARARDRARHRAWRRLAAEHVACYRELYQANLGAIPTTVPRTRARKRAAGQAFSALQKQHRSRYDDLYQQELRQARSEPLPVRPGRPPGTPDRLSLASASWGLTWRQGGSPSRRSKRNAKGARQRAELQAVQERAAVRERAAELFAAGRSATAVADELGVARWTATDWQARWRSGGSAALRNRRLGRPPAVPDSQLPAIKEALLEGADAHGFDGDVWTSARVAVVIERVTGVQLGRATVQRLLRQRLGWSFQPAEATRTVMQDGAESGR